MRALVVATCLVLGSAFSPGPFSSGKGCTPVTKDQCGTDPDHSCLKCGTGVVYDCEKCCPGCTQIVEGDYKYCDCTPPSQPGVPLSELKALCDFYFQLDGRNWDCSQDHPAPPPQPPPYPPPGPPAPPTYGCTGWNTCKPDGTAAADPCIGSPWAPLVTCTHQPGPLNWTPHIEGLYLTDEEPTRVTNVSGTISESIAGLPNLTALGFFTQPGVSGTLPSSLRSLKQLQVIGTNLSLTNWLPFDPATMTHCELDKNNPTCIFNEECPDNSSLRCLPHLSTLTGRDGPDGCGPALPYVDGCKRR